LKSETSHPGMEASQKVTRCPRYNCIEVVLQPIYDSVGGGYIFAILKEEIIALEKRRRQLLEAREVEWNLKLWSLWLENVEIL
jgi:hypothetical protein